MSVFAGVPVTGAGVGNVIVVSGGDSGSGGCVRQHVSVKINIQNKRFPEVMHEDTVHTLDTANRGVLAFTTMKV